MRISSARTRRARIEIIPLIDIVFFLLATFVMVSLSMVKNRGVPIHLPVASSSIALERKDQVSISVTEDGIIYFEKDQLTLEQLPTRLQLFKQQTPQAQVFIHGDAKAFFGHAVHVLDEVRKAGIHKVAIQTQAPVLSSPRKN